MAARRRTFRSKAVESFCARSICKPEKLVWETPKIGGGVTGSGLMSTAGGLVFYGDNTGGAFIAVDARTSKHLWQFDTNETWKSSPMTYAIDGKQYISAVAGSTVRVFALPD